MPCYFILPSQRELERSDKGILSSNVIHKIMKRWPKTAFILAAAIGLAFLVLLLPLLPFTEGYGCAGVTNIGCAPDHASASFYLFGFGYLSGDLSTPHGASTY